MSELESEYELEMDGNEAEYADSEYEFGDSEYEAEGDYEEELDGEYESDYEEEYQDEYESESESGDGSSSEYAERLFELAQMEYESESELDQELNGILNEMEQDFFWKAAKGFLKKRGRGLLGKVGKFALSKLPAGHALTGLSALARGNLKGALSGLAKTALSSHPGLAAAMPALGALGFGEAEAGDENREAWDNYVEVAQEAYENLAANITPKAANPAVASDIAKRSLQSALAATRRGRRMSARGTAGGARRGRKRVVYLAPGEYLVVMRKKRR